MEHARCPKFNSKQQWHMPACSTALTEQLLVSLLYSCAYTAPCTVQHQRDFHGQRGVTCCQNLPTLFPCTICVPTFKQLDGSGVAALPSGEDFLSCRQLLPLPRAIAMQFSRVSKRSRVCQCVYMHAWIAVCTMASMAPAKDGLVHAMVTSEDVPPPHVPSLARQRASTQTGHCSRNITNPCDHGVRGVSA